MAAPDETGIEPVGSLLRRRARLTARELRGQIEARERQLGRLFGRLYPSVLRDEIKELRDVLDAKMVRIARRKETR